MLCLLCVCESTHPSLARGRLRALMGIRRGLCLAGCRGPAVSDRRYFVRRRDGPIGPMFVVAERARASGTLVPPASRCLSVLAGRHRRPVTELCPLSALCEPRFPRPGASSLPLRTRGLLHLAHVRFYEGSRCRGVVGSQVDLLDSDSGVSDGDVSLPRYGPLLLVSCGFSLHLSLFEKPTSFPPKVPRGRVVESSFHDDTPSGSPPSEEDPLLARLLRTGSPGCSFLQSRRQVELKPSSDIVLPRVSDLLFDPPSQNRVRSVSSSFTGTPELPCCYFYRQKPPPP